MGKGESRGGLSGAHAEGRELYEAIEFVLKEVQKGSAPLPFGVFIGRIGQLLGRQLTEDEKNRILVTSARRGMLYSDDEKYGRAPVGFEAMK